MTYPTLAEIEERCNEMAKKYQIDDELFYQIVEYWIDRDLSTEEKMVKSFYGLLNQVNTEVEKIEAISELKPTCQMGCAFCCYFPIIITELEAKLLKQSMAIFPHERRDKIISHLKNYYTKYQSKIAQATSLDFKDDIQFKKAYRQLDLPCPLLDSETNQCLAYEVRPIPCRTYVNYTNPKVCQAKRMPKETVSFEFLYYPYFEALNDFMSWLYEDGDTAHVNYPDDIYHEDYLVNWLRQ